MSHWRSGALLRLLLAGGSMAHALSLLGTSFVEEEHQTYYFLHQSCQVCLLLLAASGVASAEHQSSSGGHHRAGNEDSVAWTPDDSYNGGATLRRTMTTAYHQFGLNHQVTGSMDTLLEQADNNLKEKLNNSQKQKKSKEHETRHMLILSCLGLLMNIMLFRMCRTWNATGDKWKHLPDLSHYVRSLPLNVQQYLLILCMSLLFLAVKVCQPILLVALAYLYGSYYPYLAGSTGTMELLLVYCCAVCTLMYGLCRVLFIRYSFVKTRQFTPFNFATFGVMGIINIVDVGGKLIKLRKHRQQQQLPVVSKPYDIYDLVDFSELTKRYNSNHYLVSEALRYIHCALTMVWLLLQRQDNIMVCCLMMLQTKLFCGAVLRLFACSAVGARGGDAVRGAMACAVMWMAQAFFFTQGNSNSLSRIDLSAGFRGVSEYSPILHGSLISLHTLGAPLLVYLFYLQQLLHHYPINNGDTNATNRSVFGRANGSGWWGAVSPAIHTWWCMRLGCLALYAVNVIFQRDHLFVWSVYAPKLVYEAAHTLVIVVVHALMMMLAMCLS